MTFTVIHGAKSYTIDIETIDDLFELADKYGWQENKLAIDFNAMTITIVW